MLSQSRNLLQFQATRFVRRQQFRIDPEVENQIHKRWVWKGGLSCFRTPVKVSYSRGAYVRIGGNFQNVSAAWLYTR